MNGAKTIHRQAGLTTVGWLAAIGLGGLLVISTFKVLPMYMEYYTVITVLKGISEETRIDFKSNRSIRTALEKRLYINDVKTIKKEHISIARSKNGTTSITVAYETRKPYIANLFIGAQFEHTVEIVQ